MKVWISRDKGANCDRCDVWITEPWKNKCSDRHFEYDADRALVKGGLSGSGFKEQFGFTPRKGSCKQYELSLTEIK